MSKKAKMNSKVLLYLYAFLSDFLPVFAIDKLLFQENGLTVTQIAIIVSVWGGFQLIAEIPSGILADKWNRKFMLIMTGVFFFLCYSIWVLFPSFWGYLIGFSIFYALGNAFLSGTDQAYIYDYLSEKKQEDDYEKVYGAFRSFKMLGIAFAWLIGGFVGDIFGYDLVVFMSIISSLLIIVLGFFLPKVSQSISANNENPFSFFKDSLKYSLRHPKILLVFLWAVTIGSSYRLIDEYWAVYYNWFGFNTTTIGILVFISAIIGAFLGMSIHKIKGDILMKFNIFSLVLTTIILSAGLFKGIVIIIFMMLLDPLMNISGIIGDTLLQKNALSEKRSTIASTASFLQNVFLITGLIFGMVVDYSGIQKGYLLMGFICLLYFIIYFFMKGIFSKRI